MGQVDRASTEQVGARWHRSCRSPPGWHRLVTSEWEPGSPLLRFDPARDTAMNGKPCSLSLGPVVPFLWRLARVGLWVLLLALQWHASPAHAQRYLVTELGPTFWYPDSQNLNASGQVV